MLVDKLQSVLEAINCFLLQELYFLCQNIWCLFVGYFPFKKFRDISIIFTEVFRTPKLPFQLRWQVSFQFD